jgi:5-methylcytosine-specific restriction endonuclease McrA
MARKKSIIDTIETDKFKEIVKNHNSIRDILNYFGFSVSSGTMHNKVKDRIIKEKIDYNHLEIRDKNSHLKVPLSEILVENSSYTNRHRLKIRLVKEKILKYECAECDNKGFWNGKKLSLQLDHKNGKPNDNRKENLRFLCPNCHSQTNNFSGKNKTNNTGM